MRYDDLLVPLPLISLYDDAYVDSMEGLNYVRTVWTQVEH